MADLKIDTQLLNQAATDLRLVASEFDAAKTNAERAAGAVGHGGLASAIRDFESNWDDRRAKMFEGIGDLAEASGAIGGAFEEIDTEFGAVLRGES